MKEELLNLLLDLGVKKKFHKMVMTALDSVGTFADRYHEHEQNLKFLENIEAAIKTQHEREKELLSKIGELELKITDLLLDH